jgi:hypothetical protein
MEWLITIFANDSLVNLLGKQYIFILMSLVIVWRGFVWLGKALKLMAEHFLTMRDEIRGLRQEVHDFKNTLQDFKDIFKTQNKRLGELEGSMEAVKYEVYELKTVFKHKDN